MATFRQKKAARVVANHIKKGTNKRLTKKELLQEAGYGPRTNVTTITRGAGFVDELQRLIPDDTQIELHSESAKAAVIESSSMLYQLTDKEIVDIFTKIPGYRLLKIVRGVKRYDPTTVYYSVPEHRSRLTALDMVYKLQGKYAAEKLQIDDPYEKMTDEDLLKRRRELEAAVKKKYAKPKNTQ